MIILTTLYNSEDYIIKTLKSIQNQTFKNYKCYILNDMSTDKSRQLVENFIKKDERFILVNNEVKMYQGGNYNQIIRDDKLISDNDICVEVDGDDWLPDNGTLQRVFNHYKDINVWISNSNFKYPNGKKGFSAPPKNNSTVRDEVFRLSHIRTWKAFLWRAINEDDLTDKQGNYYSVAGDLSFMYPMLEMATNKHYKYLEGINYVYNDNNPLNDHKINKNKIDEIVKEIKNKTKYKELIWED